MLVVDDEPHIRRLLRLKMEQCGYAVADAVDGRDAIRRLSENAFDLVIADIVMPERDGLEVILFLKKEQPHVKVIAVSAPGNELYLTSAQGLGAARVFPKPFELADIASAAEELLLQSQPNRCAPPIAGQQPTAPFRTHRRMALPPIGLASV